MGLRAVFHLLSAGTLLGLLLGPALAQGNFEIQVYGSETVAPGRTMVELHSNSAIQGTTRVEDQGYWWVGDHIRPRVRAPEDWHLPVGLSLSLEVGYQQPEFSPDTWTLEIRPIIDKQLGPWYFSVNPAFEQSLEGPGTKTGIEFTPAAKVSYDLTKTVSLGVEYYGTLGPVGNFPPASRQQQQLYGVVDLNVDPRWEINFGVGGGLTRATDGLIIKMILGRRF